MVSASDNWPLLSDRLLRLGLIKENYSDKARLVELVRKAWANNCSSSTYKGDASSFGLPGRRVAAEGVDYVIHGLIHEAPQVKLQKNFKKTISDQLKGKKVICEDGFYSWLPASKSFCEVKHFGLDKASFLSKAIFLGKYAYYKFFDNGTGANSELFKKAKEVKTIDGLIEVRRMLFRNYLPEPLGMNALLYVRDKGTLDKPVGELTFRLKRYFYEAKEAVRFAKAANLKELHIVVGCAHELPLEYLLKNQSLLEKYKYI